jgi:hypothetical protein
MVMAASCANESDPAADKAFFTRIYDNNRFNVAYVPLDAVQTADGGYLILANRRLEESNFKGIYLMKTDAFGGFVSEVEVEEEFVNPAGSLLTVGGKYYFFCMTTVGLETQLAEVSEDGQVVSVVDVGGSYPAVAAEDGANMILLSYDVGNKESVISLVNTSGDIIDSAPYSIGAGDAVEEPIIEHFLRTGRQLPFQVGKVGTGLYYFNGFYNYTFSMVFTNLDPDAPPVGVIQGQQDDGGFSRVIPLTGGKYAAARFNFGDNYFLPNVSLSSSGTTSSSDLGGFVLPELTPDAPVIIERMQINGTQKIIYGSNTKGKQIALFGYSESDGKFIGSRYLGFSNTFEIAAMTPTTDNGLAVIGTTYIAGRFPRVCIFKLSAEELAKSFQ